MPDNDPNPYMLPSWTHSTPTHRISLATRVWEGTVSMAEERV